jgi:hypothetical protein
MRAKDRKRWNTSPARKAAYRKYAKSAKGLAARNRWNRSAKRRAVEKKYSDTLSARKIRRARERTAPYMHFVRVHHRLRKRGLPTSLATCHSWIKKGWLTQKELDWLTRW